MFHVEHVTQMLARLRLRRRRSPPEVDVSWDHGLVGVVWGMKPGQTDGRSLEAEWRELWRELESPEMPGPGYDAQTRRDS